VKTIKKYNPLNPLVRAMNAVDRWMERMDYAGRHQKLVTG
jgi:hypothetical protein